MTDTSKEAVERHLDISDNHEAGLIPVSTWKLVRALSAEVERLQAALATARDDALEEAAEMTQAGRSRNDTYSKSRNDAAAAIRAMKGKPHD